MVASLSWQALLWKCCCGRPAVENQAVETLLWQAYCSKPCCGNLVVKPAAANPAVDTVVLQACCSKPCRGKLVVASLLHQTLPWKPCRVKPAVQLKRLLKKGAIFPSVLRAFLKPTPF